jgi:hypothetical protein
MLVMSMMILVYLVIIRPFKLILNNFFFITQELVLIAVTSVCFLYLSKLDRNSLKEVASCFTLIGLIALMILSNSIYLFIVKIIELCK